MFETKIEEHRLYFNGVNGTRQTYEIPSMSMEDFAQIVFNQPFPANIDAEKVYKTYLEQREFAPADDADPRSLEATGWGVILARDEDSAIFEALQPLLNLRQKQAKDNYYEYAGTKFRDERHRQGYIPGEDKITFLQNRGAEPFGPADPDTVPYYLLIVGDPERIPFSFQYQLDVQYAVGRIHFRSPAEYAQYAANVVAAETGDLRLARRGLFFGTNHDNATQLSADHLVMPLMEEAQKLELGWEFQSLIKEQATKENLANVLNQSDGPALLFTASHGMGFDMDDSRQIDCQGALLCQDWLFGKDQGQKIQDCYFSAADLASGANLAGLIAFHFACYSAGTPRLNDYRIAGQTPTQSRIAQKDFVARLPQRLLLNGAVAVIGHIERAWGCSISYSRRTRKGNNHLATYRAAIKRLMDGHPAGSALEWFDQKYGEISTALTQAMEERKFKMPHAPDIYQVMSLWLANNDARNYVIIGDPAARMPVADVNEMPTARPVRETISAGQGPPQPTAPPSKETGGESDFTPGVNEKHQPPQPMSYDLKRSGRSMARSLKEVAEKMGKTLNSMVDDLSTLEVLTYTSTESDLKQVYAGKMKPFSQQAVLKAATRISMDGDISQIVPTRLIAVRGPADGQTRTSADIDRQLWEIHKDMVALAQKNKVAFVKAITEVAGTLIKIAKE
jgi:hypothetical protein